MFGGHLSATPWYHSQLVRGLRVDGRARREWQGEGAGVALDAAQSSALGRATGCATRQGMSSSAGCGESLPHTRSGSACPSYRTHVSGQYERGPERQRAIAQCQRARGAQPYPVRIHIPRTVPSGRSRYGSDSAGLATGGRGVGAGGEGAAAGRGAASSLAVRSARASTVCSSSHVSNWRCFPGGSPGGSGGGHTRWLR